MDKMELDWKIEQSMKIWVFSGGWFRKLHSIYRSASIQLQIWYFPASGASWFVMKIEQIAEETKFFGPLISKITLHFSSGSSLSFEFDSFSFRMPKSSKKLNSLKIGVFWVDDFELFSQIYDQIPIRA